MNKISRWIFYTLFGLLVMLFAHTAVYSQENWNRNNQRVASDVQVQQAMQNAVLAESVVAMRESTTGRSFDPAYRASLKNTLAKLPTTQLESLQYSGGEGSLGLESIGDSRADLVYTPVTPCRVFDTRYSTAGILAGDTQRNIFVAGTTGFPGQGGNSGGCGIPYGSATSVIINFAAVAPTGAGNLRAWAVANPQPAAPLAAVMNFSPAMNALANGVAVPICDPAATSCLAGDLRLQADVGSVHVVGDVVGYFRKLDLPTAMPMGSETFPSFVTVSGGQYKISTADVVLPHNGSCFVTCHLDVLTAGDTTGYLVVKTARRDVAASTQGSDDGWGANVPVPSTYGSASMTYTWSMTGGKTYRFGCVAIASGDFIGDWAYLDVSWICR